MVYFPVGIGSQDQSTCYSGNDEIMIPQLLYQSTLQSRDNITVAREMVNIYLNKQLGKHRFQELHATTKNSVENQVDFDVIIAKMSKSEKRLMPLMLHVIQLDYYSKINI